ncbi:MAG TPA: hypothetical protein VK459_04030, partial [Polyangiaceae bacterium]|nr:hypothetical protein [Polyangiaceae bacterium]
MDLVAARSHSLRQGGRAEAKLSHSTLHLDGEDLLRGLRINFLELAELLEQRLSIDPSCLFISPSPK